MKTNIEIGGIVKNLRERSGLNQTQIAKFLEVDQSYISKCENGGRPFTVDMLEKLCDLYGCNLSDLLNNNAQVETLNFAFRADGIEDEDLVAISDINRIALNILEMKKLLEA